MRILFTVCARGGSQRLRGKNIMRLGGKPLIMHTIDEHHSHKYHSNDNGSTTHTGDTDTNSNNADHR